MALTVRFPKIDFSAAKAHWARSLAFSQHRNATSFIPTPIEPWLIKVLQTAKDLIPASNTALKEDVDGFIAQESQHFRQHRMFNKALIAQGYPEMEMMEKELEADLDDFLRNRSLKFLLAYADGFEALGAAAGAVWFENSDEWLEGADPSLSALWKWHMAEEFEHRHVCYDLYHTLFCTGFWNAIWNGYFYRIYGFIFAVRHLNTGYMKRMYAYLTDVDKARMTPAERSAFDTDEKRFQKFVARTAMPLLSNFLPWYNPSRKRVPKGLLAYLKDFEPGGEYSRAPARADPLPS